MIRNERIRLLNDRGTVDGRFVLHWMQASQRAECNHALEYAIHEANQLRKPLVVYFGLTDDFPEANERHYQFMLEGLRETQDALAKRGILLVVRQESPETGAARMGGDACLVVTDRGYLRVQKEWRRRAAELLARPLVQVETDVVVPVEEASPKEEYAAATIRPKIHRILAEYLVPLSEGRPRISSLDLQFDSFDIRDTRKALGRLEIDRTVQPAPALRGGTSEARRLLDEFIEHKLDSFHLLRNDPTQNVLSCMSPYLHFGQVSPLYIALRVMESGSPGRDAYIEELIVRRELSMNFVQYNERYDSFECIPEWARKTLGEHERDPRIEAYSAAELESAETHDPYWNAAQKDMMLTGKMHGYMRMYWGKKILEWSESPAEAFRIALYLNNKYELDGRDPNGFAGVAWCFGKHDRPWAERPIFGKVRYMNAAGLRRKFDADGYAARVEMPASGLPRAGGSLGRV